jgi:hypothetical protein
LHAARHGPPEVVRGADKVVSHGTKTHNGMGIQHPEDEGWAGEGVPGEEREEVVSVDGGMVGGIQAHGAPTVKGPVAEAAVEAAAEIAAVAGTAAKGLDSGQVGDGSHGPGHGPSRRTAPRPQESTRSCSMEAGLAVVVRVKERGMMGKNRTRMAVVAGRSTSRSTTGYRSLCAGPVRRYRL